MQYIETFYETNTTAAAGAIERYLTQFPKRKVVTMTMSHDQTNTFNTQVLVCFEDIK